jgi:hypothetical protein
MALWRYRHELSLHLVRRNDFILASIMVVSWLSSPLVDGSGCERSALAKVVRRPLLTIGV